MIVALIAVAALSIGMVLGVMGFLYAVIGGVLTAVGAIIIAFFQYI